MIIRGAEDIRPSEITPYGVTYCSAVCFSSMDRSACAVRAKRLPSDRAATGCMIAPRRAGPQRRTVGLPAVKRIAHSQIAIFRPLSNMEEVKPKQSIPRPPSYAFYA